MTHDPTTLPLRADGTDTELLESVIAFYQSRFKEEPGASRFLARRGLVHPELLATFEIGYADRELGRRLPPGQKKTGREMRERLKKLGIYRASGHGHYNGSIVIPLRDPSGQIVNIHGRKTTRNVGNHSPRHTWLPEECRPFANQLGVFNGRALTVSHEIILTDSVFNTLAFWCSELPNVTCTFGLAPPHEDLIEAFRASTQDNGIKRVYLAQRNTAEGDGAAAQAAKIFSEMDIELLRVCFPPGKDANDVLLANGSSKLQELIQAARHYDQRDKPQGEVEAKSASPIEQDATEQDATKQPEIAAAAQPPSTAAVTDAEVTHTEVKFTFDDRRYRVRGLEKNHGIERLKINLLAERRELMHVDTLDLYGAQARARFIKQAAAELYVEELVIKQDVSKILLRLGVLQEQQIRDKLQVKQDKPKELTEAERQEAEKLLRDPRLLGRILEDFDRSGLVGEETNKLVCYLSCVSRLLQNPLAIMIQSSSAAGKTTLMDGVLSFVPPEHQVRYSAMTGQSLYYMGQKDIRHKILAVSEEAGIAQASYALKLLQSDGKLKIASAGKDSGTGRQQTEEYTVEGPVMMFLTTTSETPDAELQSRCITLRVNESESQTAAIHARQSARYTLSDQRQVTRREAACQLHQNAQRLLKPKTVLIPWADQLTFRRDQTQMRRDFDKYLALIASITLLHQYQREESTGDGISYLTATLEDMDLANRLAGEVLGQSLDDLLPQTRQLLVLIDDYISQQAERKQLPRLEIRFTQRELREVLGWHDRSLRRHLLRLVELEFVLAYRTGRGNEREYQLLYDGQGRDGSSFMLGLLDVSTMTRSLRTGGLKGRTGTHPAAHRHPFGTHPAGAENGVNRNGDKQFHQTNGKPAENGQEPPSERTAS